MSKLSRSLAVVDCATREVTFDPQITVGTGYQVVVGDWVLVSVTCECEGEGEGEGGGGEGEEEREEEIEGVRPLREKEMEGKVTSLGKGSSVHLMGSHSLCMGVWGGGVCGCVWVCVCVCVKNRTEE